MSKNSKDNDSPKKVAIYSSGNIYHPTLGRVEKGYSIVDPKIAESWMIISNKIREATPEEVAMAYGV